MRDRPRPRSVQLKAPDRYDVATSARGPDGVLPLTQRFLRDRPSGDVFGLSQNAGMGWDPAKTAREPFLILSTQGGLRGEDGRPVALGYHTGHWEVGLLVREAAEELDRLGVLPFAAHVSDPCDGSYQLQACDECTLTPKRNPCLRAAFSQPAIPAGMTKTLE